MSHELVRFLRARLNEDEHWALTVSLASSPETWEPDHENGAVLTVAGNQVATSTRHSINDIEHIARHDPARVLREVEAKREIIDQNERYVAERRRMMGGWDPQSDDSPILAALATVYADHLDYREEWRP